MTMPWSLNDTIPPQHIFFKHFIFKQGIDPTSATGSHPARWLIKTRPQPNSHEGSTGSRIAPITVRRRRAVGDREILTPPDPTKPPQTAKLFSSYFRRTLRSSVPGLSVAAVATFSREIKPYKCDIHTINKRRMHHKVVIIGSGPAAHTAAVYLARAELKRARSPPAPRHCERAR